MGVVGEILSELLCDSCKYLLSLTLLERILCKLCFSFWLLTLKLWISNCHVYERECFYICHSYIIFSYNRTLAFPFTISSEHNYILFKVLFVFSVLFKYFLITSQPIMHFAFPLNLWDTFSSLHEYFYFPVKWVCWTYQMVNLVLLILQ